MWGFYKGKWAEIGNFLTFSIKKFPQKFWKFFLFFSFGAWMDVIELGITLIYKVINSHHHVSEVSHRKGKKRKNFQNFLGKKNVWSKKSKHCLFCSFLHFIRFSRARGRAHDHESARIIQNHVAYTFFYRTHTLLTS